MRTAILALALFAIALTGVRCEESRAQMIQPEPKNPEAEKLAKAIFNAISTDNYAAFTDILITPTDYVRVMRSSADPDVQKKADDSIAGMQRLHEHARRSFDRTRKDAARLGIAWERTQYKSSEFLSDTTDGVETITLKIVMNFRGVEYYMTATEVIKTARGWKLMGEVGCGDFLHYKEQREQVALEVELLINALVDSLRKADSIMEIEARKMQEADSTAAVQARRWADSIRIADSLAALPQKKKGKKKK